MQVTVIHGYLFRMYVTAWVLCRVFNSNVRCHSLINTRWYAVVVVRHCFSAPTMRNVHDIVTSRYLSHSVLQCIGSFRIRTHRIPKTHISYLTNSALQPMQKSMLLFRGSGLLQTRYWSEKQLSSIAQPGCAAIQEAADFSTRDPSISRTSSGAWCAGFRDEQRRVAERLRADHPRWSFAGAKSRLAASARWLAAVW